MIFSSSIFQLICIICVLVTATLCRQVTIRKKLTIKVMSALRTQRVATLHSIDAVGVSYADDKLQHEFTDLMISVLNGDYESTQHLINNGANVDEVTQDLGYTALYIAVVKNRLDIVELLLRNGAKVERYAKTLSYAVCSKDFKLVEMLLDGGADINRSIACCLALAVGNDSYDILKLLIDRGADVNAVDEGRNNTALHIAVCYRNPLIVKLLVENGADVHLLPDSGNTALIGAIASESEEIVKILVDFGADVNFSMFNHTTQLIPLIIAVKTGNINITKTLLSAPSIDVNAVDSHGRSALFYALLDRNQSSLEIVYSLIMHGAVVNFTDMLQAFYFRLSLD
jgi:ankyrin repeat protein